MGRSRTGEDGARVSFCASGHENQPGARFCSTCGGSLAPVCEGCGSALPGAAVYCPACGAPVSPPRDGVLRSERRVVTVLFADVVRSTSIGEGLDPESLAEVFGAFFQAMRGEIEAEGGVVEKFIGDAVMAVFGIPAAHDDDAARAVRAALRMRDRLEAVNVELHDMHGVRLNVRIGVHTGDVLAAIAPGPGEPLVTGETVITAARLEEAAGAGEVLVSGRTARAARGAAAFRDEGERVLSGLAAPVRVFVVTGESAASSRSFGSLSAPMIGRSRELELLRSLLGRVVSENRPLLVTIYGEPGVGKSRLLREFVDAARSAEGTPAVVRGRCLPYGNGVTFWPFAEILKANAGVLDSDPPDLAMRRIRAQVADLLQAGMAADAERTATALAYTVGLEDPATPFDTMEPRQVRAETHAAWRTYFSALALGGSVIVVIEDIHWAGPALLDLLEDIAERARGSLLFLCPARNELATLRPTWGGGRRDFVSLSLDPLTADESESLIGHLLDVDRLPDAVHRAIVSRTEGNPFFLEEIIRHLIDEGRITREGTRWVAGGTIDEGRIPDTIHGVLAARIDLLPAPERRVLQAASVVGRVFWPAPVGRLLDADDAVLASALEALEDRDLIRSQLATTLEGETEYSFKHILVRDVAYASLPRRDRARAHATVAGWIEDFAGARSPEFGELLAYHYGSAYRSAAEDPRADRSATESYRIHAFDALVASAREATHRFAVEKARDLAGRAVDLADTDLERAAALEQIGIAAYYASHGTEAWEALREAIGLVMASAPDDRSWVARLCARASELPARWPGAMDPPPSEDEFREILGWGFDHLDDEGSETHVRLLINRAFLPFAVAAARPVADDEYDAASVLALRAADLAHAIGRLDLESAALDAASSAWIARGIYRTARSLDDRRAALVDRLDDPFERGDIYAMQAWSATMVGDYRTGADAAARGTVGAGEELAATVLFCTAWEAACRLFLGEWDEVTDRLWTAGRKLIGERLARTPTFGAGLLGAAAVVLQARDRPEAQPIIEQLDRMAGSEGRLLLASIWRAWLALRAGDTARADEHLRTVERLPTRDFHAFSRQVRAAHLAAEERWDAVPRFLEENRRYVEISGAFGLGAHLDHLEGAMLVATQQPAAAVAPLQRAEAGFERMEARWDRARNALPLAEAVVATGEGDPRALLVDALSVFEELGSLAEIDLVRTRMRDL